MEGFGQLLAFSLVMLFGSYAAGSLPLFMAMSEKNLHLVSVLGAGLLLGVALAVIIPEGLQTLIKAYNTSPSDLGEVPAAGRHSEVEGHDDHHHHQQSEGLDSAVGISLVLGFIFMLLIDQLANAKQSRSGSVVSISGTDIEVQSPGSPRRPQARPSVNWTTTLGLVVHAAADGIAMGAAAATHQMDIEFIVFLAIMLHKAPAAFGLVTFLLHEGLERQRIRKHLMIFALAAPVLAVVTFILLAWGGTSDPVDKLNTFKATGIAMLFSAGTFLYVATVHVLPEVTGSGGGGGGHLTFTKCELLMLVIGSLMPLFLTLGHHH